MDTLAFAAARGDRLAQSDKELRDIVHKALDSRSDAGWTDIMEGASVLWLEMFEATAPDAYSKNALEQFQNLMMKTLRKTTEIGLAADDAQVDRVTKWVSTMATNDAEYHAGRAIANRSMEWVSQEDADVRPAHAAADRQRVSTSGTFLVGGVHTRYPGEPVGPIGNWINCRCLLKTNGKAAAMPTATSTFANESWQKKAWETFDAIPSSSPLDDAPAEKTIEEKKSSTAIIAALPAASDPVLAASSEEDGAHCTLIFLGDVENIDDVDGLKAAVEAWAAKLSPTIDEPVNGSAVLGPDKAQVALLQGHAMSDIRNGMLAESGDPGEDTAELGANESTPIQRAHDKAGDTFPNFLPHVTLGYEATPPNSEYDGDTITFDRLALWVGDDRTEYPMGGTGMTAAATMTDTSTEPIADEQVIGDEVDAPDDAAEVDEVVEIPFHGIAAPVGIPSGDGRMFATGGVTFRQFPFALRYVREDFGEHAGAVRVGRIDKMWVDENNMIQYTGVFNSMPEVNEVISNIVDGSGRGVSVDLDMAVLDPDASNISAAAVADGTMMQVYGQARIASLTVVQIPAFQEAYIALGPCDCPEAVPVEPHDEVAPDDTEDIADLEPALALQVSEHAAIVPQEEQTLENLISFLESIGVEAVTASAAAQTFAPGTHDGPGWITDPIPTGRIRRYWVHGEGAAKIKWGVPGDFNRCRKQLAKYIANPDWLAGACANMHKEALGVWPGQEDGRVNAALVASGATMTQAFSLVASAPLVDDAPPSEWFANPNLPGVTAMQITAEGHIFGHLATWGTCHIGMDGVCSTPPSSRTNYAHFHTGMMETREGVDMPVGHLTMGIGHKRLGVSAQAATAHYDRSDAIVADVAMGEDAYGIWYSGTLRKGLSNEKRRELKATGSISGDWRNFTRQRGNLELVGAVVVGVPGFPIPRNPSFDMEGGVQMSLVASGMVFGDDYQPSPKILEQVAMVAAVADELEFRAEKKARLTRAAALRSELDSTVHSLRLAKAREFTIKE